MTSNLKAELVSRLENIGAFEVGVADPQHGFEHAIANRHPFELWSQCRSVLVFVVARSVNANHRFVGPRRSRPGKPFGRIGAVTPWIVDDCYAQHRSCDTLLAPIKYEAIKLFQQHGIGWREPGQVQQKLCAYEAGIGVYGKSGLILHPYLGNRISIAVFLLDISLPPDPRLHGYAPCKNCNACVQTCPAKAYAPNGYHEGWEKNLCIKRRQELLEEQVYCDRCWAVCPACRLPEQALELNVSVSNSDPSASTPTIMQTAASP